MKRIIAALTVSASLLISPLFADNAKFDTSQVQQIQNIVHQYLIKNPQVLVEASVALQKQQQDKAQQAAINAIKQNKTKIFNDPNSPTAGNTKANIVIVEFFDYQCGHCKSMAPIIENILKKNTNLKVILKEFPIFGANSQYAAKTALAAFQLNQKNYWALHNKMMGANDPLQNTTVMKLAKKCGYDQSKIKALMANKKITAEIAQNWQLAKAMQLVGTPAFIIANPAKGKYQFIGGATSQQNIEKAIKAVQ